MHRRIAERIAIVAGITKESIVFEIGPGTGMLTRELLKLADKVIAVETDYDLFEKLQSDFASEIAEGRLEIFHKDIRTFDTGTLPKGYMLVANIPYYLTGEIFKIFLSAENQPSSITLLVQKEVAERIARSEKESILSLSVKVYGTPKYEFKVPRGAFNPAPKVDSAVLTIQNISRDNFLMSSLENISFLNAENIERRFFEIIHAGFAHKRKFVRKNLAEAGLIFSLVAPQSSSSGKQAMCLVTEKARAEDLSLSVWLSLARVTP